MHRQGASRETGSIAFKKQKLPEPFKTQYKEKRNDFENRAMPKNRTVLPQSSDVRKDKQFRFKYKILFIGEIS